VKVIASKQFILGQISVRLFKLTTFFVYSRGKNACINILRLVSSVKMNLHQNIIKDF